MRHLAFAAAALLALPTTHLGAQSASPAPLWLRADSVATVRSQVIAREHAGWDAIIKRDWAAYERLMPDDYHEIDMDGVRNKTDALKNIVNMTLQSYAMTNVMVTRLAKDVVILNYLGRVKGTFNGAPMQVTPFHYHVVYVHRSGMWHSLFSEETTTP